MEPGHFSQLRLHPKLSLTTTLPETKFRIWFLLFLFDWLNLCHTYIWWHYLTYITFIKILNVTKHQPHVYFTLHLFDISLPGNRIYLHWPYERCEILTSGIWLDWCYDNYFIRSSALIAPCMMFCWCIICYRHTRIKWNGLHVFISGLDTSQEPDSQWSRFINAVLTLDYLELD